MTARRFVAVTRPFTRIRSSRIPVRKHRKHSCLHLVISVNKAPLIITIIAAIIASPTLFEYRYVPCINGDQRMTQVRNAFLKRNIQISSSNSSHQRRHR